MGLHWVASLNCRAEFETNILIANAKFLLFLILSDIFSALFSPAYSNSESYFLHLNTEHGSHIFVWLDCVLFLTATSTSI